MSKLLLDTNVLIYSIDEGSKYFKKSQTILAEHSELYTTSKNISEFLAIITRIPTNPLLLNDALLIVEDFTNMMSILYPNEESFLIFQNLLKNITLLSIQDKCMVIKSDAVSFSKQPPSKKFSLILADPPFFKDDIYEVVENLKVNNYFDGSNFMIIERSIQTKSKDMFNFSVDPFKIIGDTCLYEIC